MTTLEARLWLLVSRVILDYSRGHMFVEEFDEYTHGEVLSE